MAAHAASATSDAQPMTGESATIQGSPKTSGSPMRLPPNTTKNGSAISTQANGGSASDMPLTIPPRPRCSVNQAAVRPRATRPRAGPSASESSGTAHSARTAATDIGRVSGNSAVIAASGNPAPKEASWEVSDPKNRSSPTSGPTSTEPTKTYGMESAPPRIRWIHRRRVRRPKRAVTRALTPVNPPAP